MKHETIQQIEAKITEAFIADNSAVVLKAAQIFAGQINETASRFMENFYLKGGNSISILKSVDLTGDFDFQFLPSQNVYGSWAAMTNFVDKAILNAMWYTIKYYTDSPFNADVMKCENIKKIISEVLGIQVSNVDVKNTGLINNVEKNGYEYLTYDYAGIVDLKSKCPGKKLPENKSIDTSYEKFSNERFPGCVYVNYRIPGFILYRLVCKCNYDITIYGKTEKVFLKSEIIDVSVPRPGSGEVFMSQQGVVTYFREKCGFNIPGWGYHFYENLNLLQEIELGISGSPQKQGKRIDRFNESADAIVNVNSGKGCKIKLSPAAAQNKYAVLLNQHITEPDGGNILGYFSALTYTTDNFSPYNQTTRYFIKQNVVPNTIIAYFNDLADRIQNSEFLDALYKFKINDRFSLTVSDLKEAVNTVISNYNKMGAKSVGLKNLTFADLSPYLKTTADIKCGFDYAVIFVDSNKSYRAFVDFCIAHKNDGSFYDKNGILSNKITLNSIHEENDTAIIAVNIKLSGVTRVAYLIVQSSCSAGIQSENLAREMLKYSILESQRYPLTKVVEATKVK